MSMGDCGLSFLFVLFLHLISPAISKLQRIDIDKNQLW